MIGNLPQLLTLADQYIGYLKESGMPFDERGFPIFSEDAFLDEWPEDVVTYENRGARYVKEKRKTLLCFFCSDVEIYRRLEKVFDDLPEYRKYLGVVSTDVSVVRGMEKEWEDLIMLLNQLFMAVLAVNGIKVVLNLRSGSPGSVKNFSNIPKGAMCASSTLGCDDIESPLDLSCVEKVLFVRPSKLVLYGKRDKLMEEQLKTVGISFKRYDDVHRAYKAK